MNKKQYSKVKDVIQKYIRIKGTKPSPMIAILFDADGNKIKSSTNKKASENQAFDAKYHGHAEFLLAKESTDENCTIWVNAMPCIDCLENIRKLNTIKHIFFILTRDFQKDKNEVIDAIASGFLIDDNERLSKQKGFIQGEVKKINKLCDELWNGKPKKPSTRRWNNE